MVKTVLLETSSLVSAIERMHLLIWVVWRKVFKYITESSCVMFWGRCHLSYSFYSQKISEDLQTVVEQSQSRIELPCVKQRSSVP